MSELYGDKRTRWLGAPALAALADLMAPAAMLALWRSAPAHANSDDIQVICLGDPGGFGNAPEEGVPAMVAVETGDGGNGPIQGHWYTMPGTADTSDYEDVQGQSQEGEQQILGAFATLDDQYSELTETFTVRFENDAPGGNYVECEIQIIDNDGVGAHNVRFTSSPEDGDTYRIGETIEITMDFTDPANVDGYVLVGFRVGGDDGRRAAEYHSGSGTEELVFRYEVQPGDLDADGIGVDGGYVDDEATTHGYGGDGLILDLEDQPVNPLFRRLGHQEGHRVDGSVYATDTQLVSTPASGDTYGGGEAIEIALTYNSPVEVEGHKVVGLRMGVDLWWRGATYARGSGTETLVFSYEVQPGDFDDDGISLDGGFTDEDGVRHGYGGDGTIKAAGTDVEASHRYPGLGHDPDHLVDGVAPAILSVSITKKAGSDDTYGAGDMIEVFVSFDEEVLILGTPQMTMDFDGTARTADFAPPPDATRPLTGEYDPIPKSFAVFTYTVQVGDTDADADGIAIAANALALNGGTIRDEAGNDADLSHDTLPANASHMVNGPGGL